MAEALPEYYQIHLEPDLTDFTFSGWVSIAFSAPEPVSELVLDVLDIAIKKCRIRHAKGSAICTVTEIPEGQGARVTLPQPTAGAFTLEIVYDGLINNRMAGFYRSTFLHDGQPMELVVTQFQENDARRAFPCLDQPEKKATFDILLTIPDHLQAVSNMPVQEETKEPGNRKTLRFMRTPRMSTYLLFWGVGDFSFQQDETDSRLRAVTLPGRKEYAAYGLKLGCKALAFCESYYGIPYPLAKLDLIAIPDFAFGAMENWGAITFRENLLLHYPGVTSRSGEERIFEVIAHEIAHQWFGNLVTPSAWKYIWLNESFATLFGYGVIAHYEPDWDTWETFLGSTVASAMSRDGLKENIAIELPGETEVVINTSTAPIIYNKGGSILRQIQGYIGEANFQKGVRRYLRNHQYDCAASRDLWDAFEEESDQPVAAIMQSWVGQPGLPMVVASRSGDAVRLRQQRFTYLAAQDDQQWLVPLTMRLYSATGESQELKVLLEESEQIVPIPPAVAAYKINYLQTGFYRVHYADIDNWHKLAEMAAAKKLSAADRWGLQNDLFALVLRGDVSLADYLAFFEYYRREDHFLVLGGIAANLAYAYLVVGGETGGRIAQLAIPWLENNLDRIGFIPRPGERHAVSGLRDRLLADALLFGSPGAMEFGTRQFAMLRGGGVVHPDIQRCVMLAAAITGDGDIFTWFMDRLQAAEAEHERLNILGAIGFFQDQLLVEKTLAFVLNDVPARNKSVPVAALAANPAALAPLWGWFVDNLQQIKTFHPMIYERVLAAIIPAAGLLQPAAVRGFFADYLAQKDIACDVVRLSLERLAINLRLLERNSIE